MPSSTDGLGHAAALRVRWAANAPPDLSRANYADLWHGEDRGLVASWVSGRQLVARSPDLADAAIRGELPTLPWKGGVGKPILGKKFGVLYYLAMWQGLRGDDLDIVIGREVQITCTRTGVTVTFTDDYTKYSAE